MGHCTSVAFKGNGTVTSDNVSPFEQSRTSYTILPENFGGTSQESLQASDTRTTVSFEHDEA
jgi:hypothetical protein